MGGAWSDVNLLHVASISSSIQFQSTGQPILTITFNHVINFQPLKSATIIPFPMRHPKYLHEALPNLHTIPNAFPYRMHPQ
jgi:hypothetical protein